jgi:hypothetical protein
MSSFTFNWLCDFARFMEGGTTHAGFAFHDINEKAEMVFQTLLVQKSMSAKRLQDGSRL